VGKDAEHVLRAVREKSDEASKTVETDMQFLRRRARLFLVGLFGGELKLSLVTMPTRAYRLIGSYTGTISDLIDLVSLARRGVIKQVVSNRFKLGQATEAFYLVLPVPNRLRQLRRANRRSAMRQRKVLDDNEWTGWLQWMRNCFSKGTISDIWKQIEPDGLFNPAFQKFVNTEIVTGK
jgi:hypothetical protein